MWLIHVLKLAYDFSIGSSIFYNLPTISRSWNRRQVLKHGWARISQEGKKEYKCSICGDNFTSKQSMNQSFVMLIPSFAWSGNLKTHHKGKEYKLGKDWKRILSREKTFYNLHQYLTYWRNVQVYNCDITILLLFKSTWRSLLTNV